MIKKIFVYIFSSLDNNTSNTGASARKLATFTAILTSVFLSIKHTTPDNLALVLGIWLTYGCLNSGLVTYQQLINAKLNKSTDPTTIIQTSTTDTTIQTNS